MSINRLIETGCAMALKVVSTGDINALNEAIEILQEAQHEMRMAECARIKASEREEIADA
jgi:MOSC domain-containing protein YiiM